MDIVFRRSRRGRVCSICNEHIFAHGFFVCAIDRYNKVIEFSCVGCASLLSAKYASISFHTECIQPTMICEKIVETWNPVVGYKMHYKVSNIGKVMRIKKGMGAKTGKILKPAITRAGNGRGKDYYVVNLSKNGKTKIFPVHVLVAKAFIGKRLYRSVVNHKNGVTTDNTVSNLEYTTKSGDVLHAWKTGLRASKLNTEQVRIARRCRDYGMQRFLADIWNVKIATILRNTKGQTQIHA